MTRSLRPGTPYGHLVSGLPDELRQRHQRIYDDAVRESKTIWLESRIRRRRIIGLVTTLELSMGQLIQIDGKLP